MKITTLAFLLSSAALLTAFGGPAAAPGTPYLQVKTDKPFLSYRTGEEVVFTVTPVGMENLVTNGPCILAWSRQGDDGVKESGSLPFEKLPFVYRTRIAKPGFVHLFAQFVRKDGKTNYFAPGERGGPFFSGGAAADVASLKPVPEPADFDAFWARQRARLARVPIRERRVFVSENAKYRLYAVEIDCAGPRPVTGYLAIPRQCEKGRRLPANLSLFGYSPKQQRPPADADPKQISFLVNAHGMKLPEFGGDAVTHKYFETEIRSNGRDYAFDTVQNRDPETAYFNGMALRMMRALQYLKTLPEWNGKDLWASGGSQGGLQTIWAAGCGEGVTRARCNVIWCCDLAGETVGRLKGGWRVRWSEGLGYYDPIYFGRRIPKTCYVDIYRAGMGDYISPPCGIMMLWNGMTCPGRILFDQGGTHGYVPPAYEGRDVVFTRTADAAPVASAAPAAPARRNLKVLMIGNSFSICVLRQLPQCAAAAGCGLDLCSMYIGGCPLERHWKNVVAATNAAFRPYRIDWNYGGVKNGAEAPVAKCVTNQTANIPQLLAADDWDVVTLQQASHDSWRPETYEPFGGNLVATIRRLAPKAEIVVQETWSYTPFDPRIAKWGLTPETMYAKIRPAYAQFAAKYGFRVIPTGAAVQDFRRAMPSKDGITGDPCGSPTGHDKFHLNREGEYLQACTWFTTLFRRPAADIAYRPAFLSEARAAQMRRSADAAAAALALSAAPVRGALMPNRCEKLPIGAITAEGWLGVQLGQMTEGLCGRLYEKSEFLAPQNGWLTRGGGNGWEEQAYWLRSFAKIAILTRNERMLKETGRWMAALERNADPDGWYGPQELKAGMNTNGVVVADIWPHMVMNEAVLAWWEHTGDRRWFELVNRFLLWCQAQADTRLIPPLETVRTMEPIKGRRHWGNWTWRIQNARAADLLPVIYRVYGETGDARLLNLAQRVYRKRKRADLFLNHHNVNFAQLFSYGTLFGRQSKNPADLGYADHWYGLHMAAWGAMIPRQGFAADENTRLDCYDPRYGTETCTWAEFVRSFSLLGAQTGETKWADRAEDVVFNWCPISYTPGWKELHYITAGNQVNQDAQHDHNYQNAGPMAPYSATSYRCCRHNAALALPEFTEHLTLRTPDGLVFWTYAPHAGKATVNGREVTWRMTTHYPFDAGIALEVKGAKGLALRYRVPGWAEKDAGKVLSLPPSADGRWTLTFDSKPTFRSVIRTGAVMVEKGPLTYSVALKPEVRRGKWVEVVPAEGQRWNFALDVSVAPEYHARAWNDDCFTFEHAPCELSVAARELPEWTLQDAQPAALQESPALTAKPVEKIRFIPMACARSHVTVFPTATADPAVGVRWSVPPAATVRKNRPSAFLK